VPWASFLLTITRVDDNISHLFTVVYEDILGVMRLGCWIVNWHRSESDSRGFGCVILGVDWRNPFGILVAPRGEGYPSGASGMIAAKSFGILVELQAE
jgi:hypothetical protein